MHTSLTLTNVNGHWYVEPEVAGLTGVLGAYCESIRSCEIKVEGPSGEREARCWQVELKFRIFDEIVRASTRVPEGQDSRQALSRALATLYAKARLQLAHIAEQHQSCCCAHCVAEAPVDSKAYA
jgi:hypothetical protein